MSLFRSFLDQLSKAFGRSSNSNDPKRLGESGFCSRDCDAGDILCHNPEHISTWTPHELHELSGLCSGSQCSWIVPFAGNAFLTRNESLTEVIPVCNSKLITEAGLMNWTDDGVKVSLFFHCVHPGYYLLSLRAHVPFGYSSKVRVVIMACINRASGQQCQSPVISEITIEGRRRDQENQKVHEIIPCGRFHVTTQGYIKVDLTGIQKSGPTFANISHAILVPENQMGGAVSRQKRSLDSSSGGEDLDKVTLKFVSDPEDFYFGRRGPSVHLNYQIPRYRFEDVEKSRNIKYFHNEVTVPSGQDVIGAYFCAIGFSGGYFGIQVNSPTERRILFSIWSAYDCENPDEIPADYKVTLLEKGEKVHVGEFGNEGSGAQSYLRHMWQSGRNYKFLVLASPLDDSNTMFSAWFLDEPNDWRLIATFRKPKVSTWLSGLYSFSENFIPEMGHVERSCMFGNQWAWDCDQNQWIEITQARFTADASASKGTRVDTAGGVVKHDGEERFYLRNCGFFSDTVEPGQNLCRNECRSPPTIDFTKL